MEVEDELMSIASKLANHNSKRNELEMMLLCCRKALLQSHGGIRIKNGTRFKREMSYAKALECLDKHLFGFFQFNSPMKLGICLECRRFKLNNPDDSWGYCKLRKDNTHRYESCQRIAKKKTWWGQDDKKDGLIK